MLREGEQRRAVPARRRLDAVESRTTARRPEPSSQGRRTVTITGHPTPPRRRRPPAAQGIVARPDRVALWAFLLGLFLVLVAAATANAAPL
jgi:hypothetical protein